MTKKMTKHDKKIRATANRYKKNGWRVRADISGFNRPDSIGKYKRVPDVVARKGRQTRIFEIETPKSLKTDRAQRSAFSKHAANKSNTTFKVLVAKKTRKKKR